MTRNIYVVYDKVAQESGPIFEATTDGAALRSFHKLTTGPDIDQSEFELYKLGVVNHTNNELSALGEPEKIIVKMDIVEDYTDESNIFKSGNTKDR